MGLGGVAIAVLPSVVHLQLTFSDRLGGERKWEGMADWGECVAGERERNWKILV